MLAHLEAVPPLEGCGLLGGKNGRIHTHYPIANRLNSPTAFEMEPQQLVTAVLNLESQGMALLAIYHSHPYGPAAPSPTDVARANYPEAVQLIVSFADPAHPQSAGFLIRNGRVKPISLKIV
jgi:proteasome lid subunit RPN8/RPN11